MIGEAMEIQRKKELQELLDKYKRNVEGMGSVDALKKNYPSAYKKLKADIQKAGNAYAASALKNVTANISDKEVQETWGNKNKEIHQAINNYSSDQVQAIISTFIYELMLKFREKIVICFENDEDEALSV